MKDFRALLEILERDGVVKWPGLVDTVSLEGMQQAFASQLRYPSWNTWAGFEQNERWRRLVEDLLTLDRGFVDLALNPDLHTMLAGYLGQDYVLTEARGWETIATRRNFHGWHNDAWYAEELEAVPRQLKLGVYLSDVSDNAQFQYLAGSHRPAQRPGHWNDRQVNASAQRVINIFGPAGTAFLFDTAGIHRQSTPVLNPRQAFFYNFHDPATPLLASETRYGRYTAPRLRADLLPLLDAQQQRHLGLGSDRQVQASDPLARRYPALHALVSGLLFTRLRVQDFSEQLSRLPRALARRMGFRR